MRIAIIGMGGTGTAVFANLVKKLIVGCEQHVQILLIDRASHSGTEAFAGGTAFGTPAYVHRLNTAVADMGVFPEQRHDFMDWLERNREKWNDRHFSIDIDPDAFLPRPFFAEYLKDVLHKTSELATENGIKVFRIDSAAVDITKINEKFWIELANGTFAVADFGILALGQADGSRFRGLRAASRFVDTPWPVQRLVATVPKDEPATILGTGLTAIDAVLSLVAYGHRGPIRMISRNGFLPDANSVSPVRRPSTVFSKEGVQSILRDKNRLRLSDLFRLFKLELRSRHGSVVAGRCPLKRLRSSIYAAAQNANVLQDVLVNTRLIAPWIWSLLSTADQLRFQRRFGTSWAVHRYAMPIQTARSVLKLMEAGQLEVLGGLERAEAVADGVILHTRDRGVIHADWLVDATGPAADVRLSTLPLVQNLLCSGLGSPHPAGGMRVDKDTFELVGDKERTTKLYAVGQLLSGELFATNAFWFNVDCAASIAGRVVHDLGQRRARSQDEKHSWTAGAAEALRNIA